MNPGKTGKGRNASGDGRGAVAEVVRPGSVRGPGSNLKRGRERYRAGLLALGSPGGDSLALAMSGNAGRTLANTSL